MFLGLSVKWASVHFFSFPPGVFGGLTDRFVPSNQEHSPWPRIFFLILQVTCNERGYLRLVLLSAFIK